MTLAASRARLIRPVRAIRPIHPVFPRSITRPVRTTKEHV